MPQLPHKDSRQYPFVGWQRLKKAITWNQGQHVLTCGGTGSGKTTVSGELLPRRSLVVVCVSKGQDDTLTGPYFEDYDIIRKWPPKRDQEKVMLWPANQKTIKATLAHKQEVFENAFDTILLRTGHWCIDIDETHYMSDRLKLGGEITDLLEQGRSHKISMWNNTQRPAGIPLATYVNSSHGFFFLTQEEYDVQRLGRMAPRATTPREMMDNIQRLDPHEFVYIDKSGRIPPCRSIVYPRKGTRK